jgi:hypothetical protein
MAERGVSLAQARKILKTAKPFSYYHQKAWKTGYYDSTSGIFLAAADGVVITVITGATPRYVDKLRRSGGGR